MNTRIRQRVLSLALAAAMVCSLSAGWPYAASMRAAAADYAGSCGRSLNWSLDVETGLLSVTGTGAMWNYAYSSYAESSPWVNYRSSIRSVSIDVGVTSIGDCTFCDCVNLEAVSIPDTVTSIGASAFEDCPSLADVTIPDSVTVIGDSAFGSCTSLVDVTVGSGVTSIGSEAFADCANLVRVTLPEGLATIGNFAFCYCAKLAVVTVPDGVTAIGTDAFGDVGTVYYNGTATGAPWGAKRYQRFAGEEFLTFTDNTQSVLVRCDTPFPGKLVLPKSLVSIRENAFRNCASLTEIVIPDSVTEIGTNAFAGCVSLESMTLPFVGLAPDAENADAVFGALFGCTDTPSADAAQQFYAPDASAYYSIPATLRSVTVNGTQVPYGAFYNCDFLESITLGENVRTIGQKAFFGCGALQRLTICSEDVRIAYNAFEGCGEYAICCAENTYWHLYAMRKGIRYCLTDEAAGTEFEIENGVLLTCAGTAQKIELPVCVSAINQAALRGNNRITRIALPGTVTQIGNYAFADCANLREVYLPDSVSGIGANAFSGTNATILCVENSYAHKFACAHSLNVRFVRILIDLENAIMRMEIPYTDEPEVSIVHLTGVSLSVVGIAALPDVTTYRIGDVLRSDGLVLEAHYTNGMTSILRDGFSVSQPVFSEPGEQTVTVGYSGQTASFAVTVTTEVVSGDVDGSGTLSLRDATLLTRYLAGGWGVELGESDADVNKDGKIDVKDVVLLRRYMAGGWNVALR